MSFLRNLFGKKENPINSYEDFWLWFQKNENTFFKIVKSKLNVQVEFLDKIIMKLNDYKDGYFFLTGMFNDDIVELIFTSEGTIKNIVFVEEIVQAAPKIKGWLFTALNPELNIENVSIEMNGVVFGRDNLWFYSNEEPDYPDEVDLIIIHADYNESNKSTIIHGTYIFLDNFLGELNSVTTIDNLLIIGKENATKELIPIEKLKDYLAWREKEFVEKYEGIRYDTENDIYSSYTSTLQNGNALVAVMNSDLLNWDSKASYPWILNIGIKYNGEFNNGMPDNQTYTLLDIIENEIVEQLNDFEGYLNIGRQTADSIREIYFACKDFRKPSKVAYTISKKYTEKLAITYDIYKDKYWRSFKRFQ